MNANATFMVNPQTDLAYKKEYQTNSWFAVGHFEADGHLVNWLYHMYVMQTEMMTAVDSNFSVHDETTGEYHYEDKIFDLSQCSIQEEDTPSGKGFSITSPMGTISGNPDIIHVEATMQYGKVSCTMKRTREYIYNAGTGSFMTFMGGRVQQFSMVRMGSAGSLTIGEHTFEITGDSWFDRQWQFSQEEQKSIQMNLDWRWTWMDLNLDNGETISLWDMTEYKNNTTKAWATILHADDTQEVVEIEPIIIGAGDYWRSPVTNNNYPTSFVVRIPAKQAELKIVTDVKDQEIVSEIPISSKYESANQVTGTYAGKDTAGYCYVEHLGTWK